MSSESIELIFDPLTLPTTQHRAGLAGLLVHVETLRRRGMGPLPKIEKDSDERWRVCLGMEALQLLFNDLYSATLEEQQRPQKLSKGKGASKEPLREETVVDPKTGKLKTVYIYPQIVPRAPFLLAMNAPESWVKLWRDAAWAVIRPRPKQRIPYEERAAGKNVSECSKVWKDLARFRKHMASGRSWTVPVSGTLYIGAQDTTADAVPFLGRPDEALLLHFWSIVARIYVPEVLDREGNARQDGYVLALPDVTDFAGFLTDFPQATAQLSTEVAGFRPRAALISVPQEAALEYAAGLQALARADYAETELALTTAAVEVFHLSKQGNNIPLLSTCRISLTPANLAGYKAIRGVYRHTLFRRQMILNLLRGDAWYAGFDGVFSRNPKEYFLGLHASRFQQDVASKFKLLKEQITND